MTGPASLVSVSVRMAAAAAALLALGVALTSCGDAEEDVAPQRTTTVTAEPRTTSPATATSVASPAVIPADWVTHTDSVLGFSLRYPPDLVFRDLTGPSPTLGVNERASEFRSPTEPHRGFTISISSNTEGVTPESWLLDHAACLPDTIVAGSVAGQPAAFCTSEPAEIPESAVAVAHMDKMIFIASILPRTELDLVIASVRS